jgi:hypothetical protein
MLRGGFVKDDDLASDDVAVAEGFEVLVDVFKLDLGDVVLDEGNWLPAPASALARPIVLRGKPGPSIRYSKDRGRTGGRYWS